MSAVAEAPTLASPERDAATAELLSDVLEYVRRFVVLSAEQLALVSLWIAHSHAIEAAEQTPYLSIQSPEKQSGKTRLLEVLDLLVARPRMWAKPSEAVVYRVIEQEKPTLLLDEIDAIWSAKGDEHEGLRALLNAGNRRGASVPRCVGQSQHVREFKVFGAKAIAGIGKPPDTVADRSIPIVLKRKKQGERVERFRRRSKAVKDDGPALHERLTAWADSLTEDQLFAEPELPPELTDRAQDAIEPLLAIADLAGDQWPLAARRAAVTVITGASNPEDGSLRVRLLADTRRVWIDRGQPERIKTADLLAGLRSLEEAPWDQLDFKSNNLARHLKHFSVRSKTIRFPDGPLKGYEVADGLSDAWARYLPERDVE